MATLEGARTMDRIVHREITGWGALLEYWDDEAGATTIVVGPFGNYEDARQYGDEAEASGEVEYMRGVIAIQSA